MTMMDTSKISMYINSLTSNVDVKVHADINPSDDSDLFSTSYAWEGFAILPNG